MNEFQERLIDTYKDEESRGNITPAIKRFLLKGVMFKTLKLAVFGMRIDELKEREHLIKLGTYEGRPSSGQSRKSS